jgi:hypothetical protein
MNERKVISGLRHWIEMAAVGAIFLSFAGAAQGVAPVKVVAGSYGMNCGAARGNVTQHLAAACNGTGCDYLIDPRKIGDPAPNCAKDYVAEWTCGDDPQVRRTVVAPEASGKFVTLNCMLVQRQGPLSAEDVADYYAHRRGRGFGAAGAAPDQPKAKVKATPEPAAPKTEAVAAPAAAAPAEPTPPPPAAVDGGAEHHNAESPDWGALVKAELDKLQIGRILFNPPADMTVGKTERVEVRISQNPAEEIAKGLKGRGVPQIEAVKVGTFMRVALSGGGFKLTPLFDKPEQVVAPDGFTEWAWDVLPQQAGERQLNLMVTVRIKLPGAAEESKQYPVIDKDIRVHVNPVYSVKQFFTTYWQWIAATIVLPLIGWAYKRYSERVKKAGAGDT